MDQTMKMGEFGRIANDAYLMKASPLMEHIFVNAFPPFRQDQIRTCTLQEIQHRPKVLWDSRRRFPPRFSADQDEQNLYVNYRPYDGQLDADLAFAQRLQDSIDQKDAIVYSKRKLQMQEDAEHAKSLDEKPVNKRMTRASKQQQQMATVNDTVHLQNMLEMVTPLQVIPDSEEDDDDQPIKLA
jgi:hypothetical protein